MTRFLVTFRSKVNFSLEEKLFLCQCCNVELGQQNNSKMIFPRYFAVVKKMVRSLHKIFSGIARGFLNIFPEITRGLPNIVFK